YAGFCVGGGAGAGWERQTGGEVRRERGIGGRRALWSAIAAFIFGRFSYDTLKGRLKTRWLNSTARGPRMKTTLGAAAVFFALSSFSAAQAKPPTIPLTCAKSSGAIAERKYLSVASGGSNIYIVNVP